MINPQYPQFVDMDGGCALRLVYNGSKFYYHRDGGQWDIDFKKTQDGSLISLSNISSSNGFKLTPITEEEWEKSNGQYVGLAGNFLRYGWELKTTGNSTTKNEYKYLLIRR